MKDKAIFAVIFFLSAISAFIIVIVVKTLIDMMIFSECIKHDPQIFFNHPICSKYKDF